MILNRGFFPFLECCHDTGRIGGMLFLNGIAQTMQEPDDVAWVVINCIFSSNTPTHVVAYLWQNRLITFIGYAFGLL